MIQTANPSASTAELAGRVAVAVMAKAPRAGRSKTRLVPPLTHQAAAALSAAFLRDITGNIARAATEAPLDAWVAYAPAGDEGLFDGVLASGTRLVLADGSGTYPDGVQGFGRCLLHAMEALFARGYGAVCVLNSDSPTLPTAYLRDLALLLETDGDRGVLGPADDGGYYALALRKPHAALFADIAWSTDVVAGQTRARAADAGVALTELPTWYDVDDRAALTRLSDDLRSGRGYAAPATAACLAALGVAA